MNLQTHCVPTGRGGEGPPGVTSVEEELHQGGRGAVEEGRDGQEVLQAHFLLDPREAGEGGVEGQQEERHQEGGQEEAATQAGLVQGEKVETEDKVKHHVSQDKQQQH